MSTIDQMLDALDWTPAGAAPAEADGSLPYVTHQGVLRFGGAALRVYQLSDGSRIIDAEDLEAFLGPWGEDS